MSGDHQEALAALLQRLALHQEQACQQIVQEAQQQAAELVAAATEAARQREKTAQHAEEERWAAATANLQARQATERRQHRLRQRQALLEEGWALLLEAVAQRWADPAQRALWVASLVAEASSLFPQGEWCVQHPPQWAVTEWTTRHPDDQWQADARLTAGLRIGCQGAWLDGTLQGMMANRQTLTALLLAQLTHDEEDS
ncbi:MAG: hypothetical protein HQL88_06925 [Magnetococcales bacterium]|nr:hypothetical protein [Magnetococcales bacterium]